MGDSRIVYLNAGLMQLFMTILFQYALHCNIGRMCNLRNVWIHYLWIHIMFQLVGDVVLLPSTLCCILRTTYHFLI